MAFHDEKQSLKDARLGLMLPGFIDSMLQQEKAYWLQKLSGPLPLSGVPLDFCRPGIFVHNRDAVTIRFEPELATKLTQICRHSDALLFAVFITVVSICLAKYNGEEDIIIGTTIHSKNPEVAALNKVLALRNTVKSDGTVRELLMSVRQTLSEAYANQKYPFERILAQLNLDQPPNWSPLFSVAAVFSTINDAALLGDVKNDITLVFSKKNDTLTGRIEYGANLFKRGTIEVFAQHCKEVVRELASDRPVKVAHLSMLSHQKRQLRVVNFNQTQRPYPTDKTIHRLFEEQADTTPKRIALVWRDRRFTFEELNCKANQLAHYLHNTSVLPGARVCVVLEHTPEMVIGILGALKVGATYIPCDPDTPRAKLKHILEDAQVQVVLTQKHLIGSFQTQGLKVICLDADWERIELERVDNPISGVASDALAYIIYTSGSTGEPKGVQIQHSALVNYTLWAAEAYLQNRRLSFALYSSLAFDLTVTSIFVPLVTGNTIVIYPKDSAEHPIYEIVKDNQVDVLKLTPSHLPFIKDSDNRKCRVKVLIVGGETLETDLARQVYECFGGAVEIYNEYGPTEATVGCMVHAYHPQQDRRAFVPIGRPAANMQIYILDENFHPVPELVIGELYIAGAGLALGYLNKEELTHERFIDNPFASNQRMYKSGDRARWLPEGIIEYVGRTDQQVKFHGHRVELSEIRSMLNRYPQVRDSVIVVKKDRHGNDYLVAYYISRQELDTAQLRTHLAESIVEETIPNLFVHLKKMPLTLNGKINHNALPPVDEVRRKMKRAIKAPRSKLEESLVSIWAQVLGIEQLNTDDNFFELGGHSILATQIIARIRKALHIELPVRSLFEAPTVAGLALKIEQELNTPLDAGGLTNLLELLEHMSEEEAHRLLNAYEISAKSEVEG